MKQPLMYSSELNQRIQVLDACSSSSEFEQFEYRFPYWSQSVRTKLSEAGGEKIAFLPFGVVLTDADKEALRNQGVYRCVVAASWDEWDVAICSLATEKAFSVKWKAPDWAGFECPDRAASVDLLFLIDCSTTLKSFVCEGIQMYTAKSVELVNVVDCTADFLVEAVARAKVCVSLLKDRQMEHWLYKCALNIGIEAWYCFSDVRMSLRYVRDTNENRICLNTSSLNRLRSLFAKIKELRREGFLDRCLYNEIESLPEVFENWLVLNISNGGVTKHPLSIREIGSNLAFGGQAFDLCLKSVFAGIEEGYSGEMWKVSCGNVGASGREFLDGLMHRHYCVEWAEVFIHRSFRDSEFFTSARNPNGNVAAIVGSRGMAKIGSSLLEHIRLLGYTGASELGIDAFEILLNCAEGSNKCWDLLKGLGLAATMAGEESRIDEIETKFLGSFPCTDNFFFSIADCFMRTGLYNKALIYANREIEITKQSDHAKLLKIDAHCKMGNFGEVLEAIEELSPKESGLMQIASFPMRTGKLWESSSTGFGEDQCEFYLKVTGRIQSQTPLVGRLGAIYAARLGKMDEAKMGWERFIEGSPNRDRSKLLVQGDLSQLGLESSSLKGLDLSTGTTQWIVSVNDAVEYVIVAALTGNALLLAQLRSIVGNEARLAGLVRCGNWSDAEFLRGNTITLLSLLGKEVEPLANRMLPKTGRSNAYLPRALSGKRLDSLFNSLDDFSVLTQLVRSVLEPRFLDI